MEDTNTITQSKWMGKPLTAFIFEVKNTTHIEGDTLEEWVPYDHKIIKDLQRIPEYIEQGWLRMRERTHPKDVFDLTTMQLLRVADLAAERAIGLGGSLWYDWEIIKRPWGWAVEKERDDESARLIVRIYPNLSVDVIIRDETGRRFLATFNQCEIQQVFRVNCIKPS